MRIVLVRHGQTAANTAGALDTVRPGLPLTAEGVTADAMYADLFHDKKTVGGRIHWVLAEEIGRVSVHSEVPEELVRKILSGLYS